MVIRVGVAVRLVNPRSLEYDLSLAASRMAHNDDSVMSMRSEVFPGKSGQKEAWMVKSRILIVEDERITSDHLHRLLKRRGYEIAGIAANGHEALDQMKQVHPDLMLVDIGLPGAQDGVQVAQRAREDEIPVVFLTAFSDPATIRRARESEPYGFIVKPFVEEELQATIEIALQQHAERMRREEETLATSKSLSSTKEELRAITARVFRVQEEERAQIARDLHDDVSQRFALLQMSIEALWQTLPQEIRNAQAADYNGILAELGALAQHLRDISHQLHPSILDDLGLVAALKSLAETFERRCSLPIRVIARDLPEHIDVDLSVELYRIAQEALNNVVRHAGEDVTGTITLQGSPDGLVLSIRDTGSGMDTQKLKPAKGLGLKSMAERATLAGGSLAIESELGEGTCIRVRVPLPDRPEDANN
jgi:signal transduction histidine kinase